MFIEFQRANGEMTLVNTQYIIGVFTKGDDTCFISLKEGRLRLAETYEEVVKKIQEAERSGENENR